MLQFKKSWCLCSNSILLSAKTCLVGRTFLIQYHMVFSVYVPNTISSLIYALSCLPVDNTNSRLFWAKIRDRVNRIQSSISIAIVDLDFTSFSTSHTFNRFKCALIRLILGIELNLMAVTKQRRYCSYILSS